MSVHLPLTPSTSDASYNAVQSLFSVEQRDDGDTTDDGVSPYLIARQKYYSPAKWQALIDSLDVANTVYVGNLSFLTTEEQLYTVFSECGRIERVIMGLNQLSRTPCGFCFVVYFDRASALLCQRWVSGMLVDERQIRADIDPGFEPGRQFGRSKLTGGQIRDDHRRDVDPGRISIIQPHSVRLTPTPTRVCAPPSPLLQLTADVCVR